jgi:hypothetical protein
MSGLAHLRPEQLLAAADLIAGGLAAARCCIHDVASASRLSGRGSGGQDQARGFQKMTQEGSRNGPCLAGDRSKSRIFPWSTPTLA